jgi:hypothetical protein
VSTISSFPDDGFSLSVKQAILLFEHSASGGGVEVVLGVRCGLNTQFGEHVAVVECPSWSVNVKLIGEPADTASFSPTTAFTTPIGKNDPVFFGIWTVNCVVP